MAYGHYFFLGSYSYERLFQTQAVMVIYYNLKVMCHHQCSVILYLSATTT